MEVEGHREENVKSLPLVAQPWGRVGRQGLGWGLGGPGMWPETMTAHDLTKPTSLLTLALCNGAC